MPARTSPQREAGDRPAVSDQHETALGRRFTLTFAPGQRLPSHRSRGRVALRVLSGGGLLLLEDVGEVVMHPSAAFQLDPDTPHAVVAGPDGLTLRVETLTPDGECC